MDYIDVEKVINSLKDLYVKMLIQFFDFVIFLIVLELLFWKVLGGGLIEKEFIGYYDVLEIYNFYLKFLGLFEKFESVKELELFIIYILDKNEFMRKEFGSKYKIYIIC